MNWGWLVVAVVGVLVMLSQLGLLSGLRLGLEFLAALFITVYACSAMGWPPWPPSKPRQP